MEEKIKIIRSAVGSPPSLGLIQELQKNNIEIIGIDASPLSFGLYNLEKRYLVPLGKDSNFIKEILKIIDIEKPNAILSGPEQELIALSRNKKQIEEKGVKVLLPDIDTVEICTDKLKTYEKFKEIEIPFPELLSEFSLKFPCIIKPRFGSGSANVYKAENQEEFKVFIKKVKEPIIQEFCQGQEYTIDVLSDKEGNALSIVPRLRLSVESGISIKAKTIYDKEIIEYCEKIVKELKIFGPCCIQCIKDKEINFLEINLRFGGGSILSIRADSTIIPNLKKLILDQTPVPSNGFKQGLYMFRNYTEVYANEDEILKNETSNF